MLISCWSAKGGAGTTVVSVALAGLLARTAGPGALLVDLAGDVPAVLGRPDPSGPGLAGWSRAGGDVPADALARLELDAGPGIALLPRGDGPLGAATRGEVLAGLLAADGRPVVVDCGRLDAADPSAAGVTTAAMAAVLAGAATRSLLVTRCCYLALKRAATVPVTPSGVVLVQEAGRSLGVADVEEVVGAPVEAVVAVDPAVARAVDAGVLAARLPRGLARSLRHAA